jgi:transcriptional regulator with XRE-family HTH domain
MRTNVTVGDYLSFRQKVMGAKIVQLRHAYGLSQQDLAALLGCSRSRIARIETGQGEYTLSELEVLALRFGADPLVFLELTHSERALLDYAYAHSVSYPALGQAIKCAHPAGGAVKKPVDPLAWSPDSRFLAASVIQRGADEAAILCIWMIMFPP